MNSLCLYFKLSSILSQVSLFFRMYHPCLVSLLSFSKSEGDFSCPWVLTAREIDPNEVVSLLVWRGISWVDDAFANVTSCCYCISSTQFIVWYLSHSLSLSLTHTHTHWLRGISLAHACSQHGRSAQTRLSVLWFGAGHSWVDDCVCWCYLLLLLFFIYTIYCVSIFLSLSLSLVACLPVFMVGVDRRFQSFFYSLACFTLYNVSPSFGILLFLNLEGGFSCQRVLIAREIGACEYVSLYLAEGHSLVDDCVCWYYLLLLLFFMYTIYSGSISFSRFLIYLLLLLHICCYFYHCNYNYYYYLNFFCIWLPGPKERVPFVTHFYYAK